MPKVKKTTRQGEKPRTRPIFIAVAIVILTVASVPIAEYIAEKKLDRTIHSLDIPSEWERIVSKNTGNIFCLDACISRSLIYNAPDVTRENAIPIFETVLSNINVGVSGMGKSCASVTDNNKPPLVCTLNTEIGSISVYLTFVGDEENQEPVSSEISLTLRYKRHLLGLFGGDK